MEVYSLYVSKADRKLLIGPKRDDWWLSKKNKEDILKYGIIQYSPSYYLGVDRKILREKAKEIKQEWIKDAEKRLRQFTYLKIITKYK